MVIAPVLAIKMDCCFELLEIEYSEFVIGPLPLISGFLFEKPEFPDSFAGKLPQ